jgi:hypothetical protein
MEKRRLAISSPGETGLEITRVGFGAWAIGGSGCSRSARAVADRLSGRGPVSGLRPARWGAPRLAAVLIVITALAGAVPGSSRRPAARCRRSPVPTRATAPSSSATPRSCSGPASRVRAHGDHPTRTGVPRDLRLRARRPDHPRPAGGPTAGAGPPSAQRGMTITAVGGCVGPAWPSTSPGQRRSLTADPEWRTASAGPATDAALLSDTAPTSTST